MRKFPRSFRMPSSAPPAPISGSGRASFTMETRTSSDPSSPSRRTFHEQPPSCTWKHETGGTAPKRRRTNASQLSAMSPAASVFVASSRHASDAAAFMTRRS